MTLAVIFVSATGLRLDGVASVFGLAIVYLTLPTNIIYGIAITDAAPFGHLKEGQPLLYAIFAVLSLLPSALINAAAIVIGIKLFTPRPKK